MNSTLFVKRNYQKADIQTSGHREVPIRMIKRKSILAFLALTMIVIVVVAVSTEGIRNYMNFEWQVNEGDQFLYDVSVTGYFRPGEQSLALTLAPLNNTQVMVEVVSLPDVPLFISPTLFAENVIEFVKTDTTHANGTSIHVLRYYEINTLASRCILPRGTWSYLSSFYPDEVLHPTNASIQIQSYFAYQVHEYFIIGFASYAETAESGWFGYILPETGVPYNMTSWGWSSSDIADFSYVMTLTAVSES